MVLLLLPQSMPQGWLPVCHDDAVQDLSDNLENVWQFVKLKPKVNYLSWPGASPPATPFEWRGNCRAGHTLNCLLLPCRGNIGLHDYILLVLFSIGSLTQVKGSAFLARLLVCCMLSMLVCIGLQSFEGVALAVLHLVLFF